MKTEICELAGVAFEAADLEAAFGTARKHGMCLALGDDHELLEEALEVAPEAVRPGRPRHSWLAEWIIYREASTGRSIAEELNGPRWSSLATPAEALLFIRRCRDEAWR